jgi:integrase
MAQDGYVFKKGASWFLRYRDDVIEDGHVLRKQRCKRLAPVSDQYRTEKDLRGLVEETLGPINGGKVRPESTLTVAEFGETCWLPWVRENCKPSTVAGYETTWRLYLAPYLRKITLRDFRTVDAANLFVEILKHHKVGRTMIQHCKRRLSALFTLARNQGALDAPNPVEGAMLPKKAAAPARTHAATPDEVTTFLDLLEKAREWKARAAVGLMFFAGLRPGEARGARWEDYTGKRLFVRQSLWHTYATAPKTEEAASPVPVIDTLEGILRQLREADGNPTSGPILRGPSGKPLNLDNLSKRVMMPLLKAAGLTWHGWYSLRRGVATTLASLTHDGMASKGLLRHTDLATTTRHYVKDVPENTLSAMNRLETLFNECATRDSHRLN